LEGGGKEVHIIPMSELLWTALEKVHRKDDDEGLGAVVELEKQRGYVEAQHQVTTYLSSKVWIPLWDLLAERLVPISPENSLVFLTRVAAMSPGIFHISMLLDKMHGKTKVPTILFYPWQKLSVNSIAICLKPSLRLPAILTKAWVSGCRVSSGQDRRSAYA
jgi:hypothetical protein